MLKKILSLALATIMVMGMGTTAFAASDTRGLDTEHVGDTVIFDSQKYIVFQENDNGTVYAVSEDAPLTYAACQHRALEPINPMPYPPTMSKNPDTKTSTYCYKKRTVQDARCTQCGQRGFVIFGTWSKVGHDYPWFGSECKKCHYKK